MSRRHFVVAGVNSGGLLGEIGAKATIYSVTVTGIITSRQAYGDAYNSPGLPRRLGFRRRVASA